MAKEMIGYFGWVIAWLWIGAFVFYRVGGFDFLLSSWWGVPAAFTAGIFLITGGWASAYLAGKYL